MKKIFSFILISFVYMLGYGQEISGHWKGILKIQSNQLRVIFNISKTDSGYVATMDSPDQNTKGIPVSHISFQNSLLKLDAGNLGLVYEGKLQNDSLIGKLKQSGQSFDLALSRAEKDTQKPLRPQEPSKPYPYYSEEIKFENKKDGIVLQGTFTLPQKTGSFPAVVLISGSGPQNRDEELFDHKPFLVIADHLTKKGIAVLRFDDRGTAGSGGVFNNATSLDFASDVESALKYLRTRNEIDTNKIGLIGHSEGGIIAPIIASRSKNIRFIVLLAGTGISGGELLLLQSKMIKKASGFNEIDLAKSKEFYKGAFDIIQKSPDDQNLETKLNEYIKESLSSLPVSEKGGLSDENFLSAVKKQLLTNWMKFFIKYNPAVALEKVKCPVLALNGENDLQVPPKVNLEAIKLALVKGGNTDVTTKELPKLNHLFQESVTGLPTEYGQIQQTFSPTALSEMTNWILNQISK